MSIAAKDATGAALTLASVTTPLGEAPGSTPVDPVDGLPFKASSEATLELIRQLRRRRQDDFITLHLLTH